MEATVLIQWENRPEAQFIWPPLGQYVCLVRFNEDTSDWPNKCWTLVVNCVEVRENGFWEATIRFIADGAPTHYFYPGSRFQLYEVWDVVASGEVI